ncbi:MAG: response regulator transcription factor [Nitriliruptoraceae bacterium]|nr:response regulator transcription factor [Nitriliruptoraceae bacterium]
MIRVLLVEDHLTFAQALRAVIDLEPDMEVVDVVTRGDAAGPAAARTTPDVAVLDLDLPGGSGIEAVAAMRAANPATRFLVLTALRDRLELARVVEAGVAGLLHKSIEMPVLLDAVRRVAAGENLLPAEMVGDLLSNLGRVREGNWQARLVRESLSARELEVLAGLAQGRSVSDLAAELHISPTTVETHLKNARAKLGASSRLEAVVEAMRLGLVAPPDGLPLQG